MELFLTQLTHRFESLNLNKEFRMSTYITFHVPSVFRAKFKGTTRGSALEFRKGRWFKPRDGGGRRARPDFRSFDLESKDSCCSTKLRPGAPYIVMGITKGDQRVVTFVMPWSGKDKVRPPLYPSYQPLCLYVEVPNPRKGL
jgi:hypothetical protein